jgi:predicted alpha/beta-hydrolase family hydrolase
MAAQNFSLQVSPETGKVSAALLDPEKPICIMTFAHGAGAGMQHSFMVALAEALAEKDIATLRFNFPFVEKKTGRPDKPEVAHQTIEMAVQHARKKYPSLPVLLSGKSFGGRMSSQWLATHPDDITGIVFYGFPLHAIGKPSIDRA